MERQRLYMSRTPSGLEAYIPSGSSAMPKMAIVVNQCYSAVVDLRIGITVIPREVLKNQTGQAMPVEETILSASASSPDDAFRARAFSWSSPEKERSIIPVHDQNGDNVRLYLTSDKSKALAEISLLDERDTTVHLHPNNVHRLGGAIADSIKIIAQTEMPILSDEELLHLVCTAAGMTRHRLTNPCPMLAILVDVLSKNSIIHQPPRRNS